MKRKLADVIVVILFALASMYFFVISLPRLGDDNPGLATGIHVSSGCVMLILTILLFANLFMKKGGKGK